MVLGYSNKDMEYTIALTKGKTAVVSPEDYDWATNHKWFASHGEYAARKVKGKTVYLHRLIANAQPGEIVDHINRCTLDNRRENLRIVTRGQNRLNSRGEKLSTSSFKGVSLHRHCKTKPWHATIKYLGKPTSLGYFATELEAAQVYDKAARELFGEYSYLNFSAGGN